VIRLAHSADWHLNADASCAGTLVRDASGQNVRWLDQQRVISAFVDGAIAQQCDIAIIAGDVFDKPKPGPAEIVFAQQQIGRLHRAMPCLLLHGNHDLPVNGIPSPVEILASPPLGLYAPRPDRTVVAGLQLCTLPFPSKVALLAREEYAGLAPDEVHALITDKLRAIVRGLRAQCDPIRPAILVAHLPIVGAALNETMLAGQEHISLTAEDLEGWEYVALGDLHRAQQIAGLPAFYSGSLDRLNFGEEHDPKGWMCVELGDGFSYRFMETPARRFVTLTVDELRHSEPCPDLVYRVKAAIRQEEFDAIQPDLARWRQCPLFSEALEITRQTRARAETVTDELSPAAALAEWARTQGKTAELAALLALHREIAGAAP